MNIDHSIQTISIQYIETIFVESVDIISSYLAYLKKIPSFHPNREQQSIWYNICNIDDFSYDYWNLSYSTSIPSISSSYHLIEELLLSK